MTRAVSRERRRQEGETYESTYFTKYFHERVRRFFPSWSVVCSHSRARVVLEQNASREARFVSRIVEHGERDIHVHLLGGASPLDSRATRTPRAHPRRRILSGRSGPSVGAADDTRPLRPGRERQTATDRVPRVVHRAREHRGEVPLRRGSEEDGPVRRRAEAVTGRGGQAPARPAGDPRSLAAPARRRGRRGGARLEGV